MDTLNIKNDLADLKANGYIIANARIKTNFKKSNSYGGILIRDGNIFNRDFKILYWILRILYITNQTMHLIHDVPAFVNQSK